MQKTLADRLGGIQWWQVLSAGLLLAGTLSGFTLSGCANPNELSALRAANEANQAGFDESVRAGNQRRNADRVIRYDDMPEWEKFQEALSQVPLGKGTVVVAYPMRLIDPDENQLDTVDRMLKRRGFSRVIQHLIMTQRILILRE